MDRGTNQPNVFFDPKSSESFTPYFSRGWRDDAVQRAYLKATFGFWGNIANNPTSGDYGASMVHVPECAAWTWDARPYPFFPELTDVWSDGPNWRLGHWLTGRPGAVSLAALVRHLCLRAGLAESRIDVSGLWGAVEGYVITTLESPRGSEKLGKAADAKADAKSPALRPGGRLIREWNGVTHVVDVAGGGFVWNGQHHGSLSAIARAITGARWSGPRFFGLNGAAPR